VTRSGSDGRRRAVAYLLAVAAAVIGLGVQTPAAAAAAEPQLTFTMTSLKTSGYDPDDRVTLEGTVTNTGSTPAYGVQVILWRSRDPIQSLATLRQATANNILGSRLPISADHYVVVSTSTEPFVPGQAEVVTLRATMAELGFDTRGAAFALGADLIASATADNATDYPTVAQLRTFLPVPGKKKVPVTSIVLLSAPPTKLVDNLFRDDSLAAELTGRLSSLLYTAAQPGMSWLIDPALLDAVRDMADGYEVVGADANATRSGQATALAWLERFSHLDHDTGGRTLFASPDLDGARVAGDTLVVSRSERAAATVAGLDDLPLVVVPAGGILTAASYDFLSGSGADLAVATNTVAAGALQAGAGDRPLVLAASAAVPAAAETPANLGRQLALAAAVVAGSRGEVRLLDTLADVEQDSAAMAGWLVRRDLEALRDSAPRPGRVSLVGTKPARLSTEQFERLHRLESDFTAHAELAPESQLTAQSDAAVSRAAASAWVGDADGFDQQLAGVAKLVGMPEVGRSVVLDASPRFVMSSRANQFPVTVTNNLTEPVQVKVVVTTDNPQRLTVPPSEVITVPPNQGVTVNIRLEATSNGVVAARAYLATKSGHRVSPDTPITVEVTDIGVVAWIIVGVSGLVLVGATAWRIRQVRRRTEPLPAREVTE
jgi:hypothetical protein